jgi:hypothetical protein
MRQGHALNLVLADEEDRLARATSAFETTISLSKSLDVPRLSVEANWGLCRAYGYHGDLQRAQRHAQEAIDIAAEAGDEWISSLTRLSMGASLMLAARYEAAEVWLNRAVRGFEECSDSFGRSTARLWLAYGHFKQKNLILSRRSCLMFFPLASKMDITFYSPAPRCWVHLMSAFSYHCSCMRG